MVVIRLPQVRNAGLPCSLAVLLLAGGVLARSAQGQITPDGTLGPPGAGQSTLTPGVIIRGQPALQIDGGVVSGNALFHSFSNFNVANGQRVYFADPAGIGAIVTRVTGSNTSNILGTLGVNGTASLFLLNPNGIFFGPNARLDIAGAFVASTAEQFRFPDGSSYSATNPQAPPLLTINLTPGVQLGATPTRGTIQVATASQLTTGQDLTLRASNLQVQGQLRAGGNLTLEGTNLLQVRNANLSVTGTGPTLGNISLTSQGPVLVDNTRLRATVTPGNFRGGGNVLISSANLTITNGSDLTTDTQGNGAGGNLQLVAVGRITIDRSRLSATTNGNGPGGSLQLSSNQLQLQNGAALRAVGFGRGSSGNLIITAGQSARLGQSLLAVETQGPGAAGFLRIATDTLTIDGTKVSTTVLPGTTGAGGDIFVNASTINILGRAGNFPGVDASSGIFAGTLSTGSAGSIYLQPFTGSANLTISFLDPNTQITASGGQGAGGSIAIAAPGSVTVQGNGQVITVATRGPAPAGRLSLQAGTLNLRGIRLEATTFGSGPGGDILIQANSLTMTVGARLTSDTQDRGAAGNLQLQVSDRLTLSDLGTGLFAGTAPGSTGNSGNILIDPAVVVIQNGAAIAVNSQGQGLGGNITLQAGNVTLDQGGLISAETASSDGGNINLQVSGILLLRNNSLISATAGGRGNGGNITIKAGFVVAPPTENSDISANAFLGNGGTLRISTQGIFGLAFRDRPTPLSDLTASSQFGVDGQVILNTPNTDPQRGLVPLSVELVDVTQKIVQGCVPNRSRQAGQFTNVGRGGLPPTPADPQSAPLFWQDLQLYGPTQAAPAPPLPPQQSSQPFHAACSHSSPSLP